MNDKPEGITFEGYRLTALNPDNHPFLSGAGDGYFLTYSVNSWIMWTMHSNNNDVNEIAKSFSLSEADVLQRIRYVDAVLTSRPKEK